MHIYVKFCESVPEEKCYLNAFEAFPFPHRIISFGQLYLQDSFTLACVASVSVWLRSKERPRNGIVGFGRARNGTRAALLLVPFFARSLTLVPRQFFARKPHGNAFLTCVAGGIVY